MKSRTARKRANLTKGPKHGLGPAYWVFVMKSGDIEKFYGTRLEIEPDTCSVYNERIITGFVKRAEVVDHWAQDEQTCEREKRALRPH